MAVLGGEQVARPAPPPSAGSPRSPRTRARQARRRTPSECTQTPYSVSAGHPLCTLSIAAKTNGPSRQISASSRVSELAGQLAPLDPKRGAHPTGRGAAGPPPPRPKTAALTLPPGCASARSASSTVPASPGQGEEHRLERAEQRARAGAPPRRRARARARTDRAPPRRTAIRSSPSTEWSTSTPRLLLGQLERPGGVAGTHPVGRSGRLRPQLSRAPAPHRAPAPQHGERVAHLLDLADLVARQKDRGPSAASRRSSVPTSRTPRGPGRWSARRAAAAPAIAAGRRRSRAAGASRSSSHSPGQRRARPGRPARAPRRPEHAPAPSGRARPAARGSPARTSTGRTPASSTNPATPSRSTASGDPSGRPSSSTSPASGISRPNSMRSSVVLPAPLGPSRPAQLALLHGKSTPSTAQVDSKRLTSPLARTAATVGRSPERVCTGTPVAWPACRLGPMCSCSAAAASSARPGSTAS